MCKVHTLIFTCGHGSRSHLSTCFSRLMPSGPIVNGRKRKECRGYPYIIIRLDSRCMECRVDEMEEHIVFLAETIRISNSVPFNDEFGVTEVPTPDEVEAWQEARLTELSQISRGKSSNTTAVVTTWQSGRRGKTGRKGSLLRQEVKPEDVVGFDDWETVIVGFDEVGDDSNAIGWGALWERSDEASWGGSWAGDDETFSTDSDTDRCNPPDYTPGMGAYEGGGIDLEKFPKLRARIRALVLKEHEARAKRDGAT